MPPHAVRGGSPCSSAAHQVPFRPLRNARRACSARFNGACGRGCSQVADFSLLSKGSLPSSVLLRGSARPLPSLFRANRGILSRRAYRRTTHMMLPLVVAGEARLARAERYQQYATACLVLAERARPDAKLILSEMADAWLHLAELAQKEQRARAQANQMRARLN